MSASNKESSNKENSEDSYVVLSRGSMVEGWSVNRLPFQPRGRLEEYRKKLCAEVEKIAADPNKLLRGLYVSPITDPPSDLDNILFYNVSNSESYFMQLPLSGIQYERSFSFPPPPSEETKKPVYHYQRYDLIPKGTDFELWSTKRILVRWKLKVPTSILKGEVKTGHFWYWMSHATVLSVNVPEVKPQRLGIKIDIKSPINNKIRTLSKKLLDGLMSSFYKHNGISTFEITKRLSRNLHLDEQDIAKCFNDDALGVLGKRRLLWPWGSGVQWNPGDDSCVAGRLSFLNSTNDFVEIAGELFDARKKD